MRLNAGVNGLNQRWTDEEKGQLTRKGPRLCSVSFARRQMAKDYIGYQALTDAALRSVVRDALKRVEKQGLIASHHFCITFKTEFPGVEIPDFLREQYPDEMMIILQHQYSGLKVREDFFQVTLSFKKVPAALTVPFAALTQFMDPGVQFGLQFQGTESVAGERKPSATTALPGTKSVPLAGPKPVAEAPKEPEKPAAPAEVVSLDAFRKK
jgi:hypothetical protein